MKQGSYAYVCTDHDMGEYGGKEDYQEVEDAIKILARNGYNVQKKVEIKSNKLTK